MASAEELVRSSSTAPASGRVSPRSRLERDERKSGREGALGKLGLSVPSQESLRGFTKGRRHLGMGFSNLLEYPLRRRVGARLRRLRSSESGLQLARSRGSGSVSRASEAR